mmetsp:Transcript_21428/g.35057  ORF Transcript_21428/g.35057 Transcript_21428/m.35057 type:complete len:88 (+) Transcript_21428:1458-1721(+)|eukprot:scaffold33982_cov297-Skeletonema_menzelii.AAC.1
MFNNFRPYVEVKHQNNVLYREPTPEEWAKVKQEKKINKDKKAEVKKMKMKCEKVESNVPDSDSRKTKKPRTTHPGGDTDIDEGGMPV